MVFYLQSILPADSAEANIVIQLDCCKLLIYNELLLFHVKRLPFEVDHQDRNV